MFLTVSLAGLSLITLAFSLTQFLAAPTLWLWKTSIAATEFGHFFAILAFILGFLSLSSKPRSALKLPLAAVFFGSGLLLLYPATQSRRLGQGLDSQLKEAFGADAKTLKNRGFSWKEAYFPKQDPLLPPLLEKFARSDQSPGLLYYYPPAHPNAPLIVVIHGGAWNSGDPLQLPELNTVLVQGGYAVAAVNYRFIPVGPNLPGFTWPTQKNDVLSAIDDLRSKADDLGFDPSRLVILGRSAGGQIAETVAFDPPARMKSAIRGLIGFYSPADMNFAYQYGSDDDILQSLSLLKLFFGGTPEQVPEKYHTASGYDFIDEKSPPALLIHGRRDELVWFKQSERLRDRMMLFHRPVMLLDLPWATHAFDFNIHGPGGQLSTQAVLSFLKVVTR